MSEVSEDLEDRDVAIEHVKRKRLLEELSEEERNESFASVLKSEAVRDYLWSLISRCGVYQTSQRNNFGEMSGLEGRRQIGLMILADINLADPEAWREMQLKASRAVQAEHRERSLKKLRPRATP